MSRLAPIRGALNDFVATDKMQGMKDVLRDSGGWADVTPSRGTSGVLRLAAPDTGLTPAGRHRGNARVDTVGDHGEWRAAQLPVPRKPELLPDGGSEAVLERVPQKVEPPPLHRVVLLNDDYTPMEFVVMVLQEFFNKDRDTATQIMLQVHVHGRGVCGVYTADIAATKVNQVLKAAGHAGHPLQCISEPVD